MSHLPPGWIETSIEDVFAALSDGRTLHQGWSPQCEKEPSNSEDDWGVLKTTAIQDGAFLPEHNKRLPDQLAPRPLIEVHEGDILITCAGPRARCGISCLVHETRSRLMISGKMYRFRAPEKYMDPRYVAFYLQTAAARFAIDRMKTGGSDSGLNLTHDRFRRLRIPIAPHGEQGRIVAAIEEQFSRLDAGDAALERVRQNLQRMRAAVLQAAAMGQLVPQEANDEPATLWMETYGKSVDGKVSGLPPGWARTTIGELKTWSLYGPRFTSDDYVAAGIPVLRTTDITPYGRIRVDQAPKLALSDSDLQKYRVMPGDILVTRTGSIGTVAFIGEDRPAIPGAYLILYRFGLPIVFSEFIFFLFQAPHIQRQFIGKSAGIGRPNLNAPSINATVVDVPPFAEVIRIVDEVKRVLSSIERLEADIKAVKAHHHKLRSAVLAAAFSGQLAPQEPTDEPASVLLEKIGADRAVPDGQRPKGNRRIPRPGRKLSYERQCDYRPEVVELLQRPS